MVGFIGSPPIDLNEKFDLICERQHSFSMQHSSPDVDQLHQNKKTDHRVAGFAIGSPETFPW
jgi:hypothetical protein